MTSKLYDGDTFEHRGYTFKVTFEHDECISAPWKEFDGHGVVSEWTMRDKRPGERVLMVDDRGRSKLLYDVQATMRKARTEGWSASGGVRPGETKRAQIARAVEEDYAFLRAFCTDQWEYVVVRVVLMEEDEDGDWSEDGDFAESLGGVETWKDYHVDVARDLAEELMSRIEVEEPNVQVSEN